MAHHRLSRILIPAAFSGAMLFTSACGELAQEPQFRPASAPLALALALPAAGTASSAWGADLDAVRVTVSRRNESTALDTLIAWSADADGLRLAFDIPLEQRVETLFVSVDLLAGQAIHFYANNTVVLRAEVVPAIPPLPLTYIGPGSDAVSFSVTPRSAFVLPRGTLTFVASAFNGQGLPVAAPVAWSVSDARIGSISATGVLTATARTGSVWVRAAIPTGLADSVQVLVATQAP
jgi:hypothetical protein